MRTARCAELQRGRSHHRPRVRRGRLTLARLATGAELLARPPEQSRSRGSRRAAALFLLIGGEPIGEPVMQRGSGLHDGSRALPTSISPAPVPGPGGRSSLSLSVCFASCLPTPLLRKMAGLNASSVGS